MALTVLDELITLLAPERLLKDERANGEGVSVAVIDTGIDRLEMSKRHPAAPGIEGAVFRGTQALPYDGRQSSPHGTIVADVILSIAPQATLFSADVFGNAGTCEVETVVAAIRHAMDVWKVKLINISLGVQEQKLQQLPRKQLLRAIEEAYFRDVIIVAAAHNDHPITKSYPAVYSPPLLSVDKGLFDDPLKYAYQLREQVEFQAHSRGYFGGFAREPATSWATPHLSGIACRILSLKPNMKPFELKTILYWMSQSRHVA